MEEYEENKEILEKKEIQEEKIEETENITKENQQNERSEQEEKIEEETESISSESQQNEKSEQEENIQKEIKNKKTIKLSKKWIILSSIIILIILISTTGFAILNMKNSNIISGITIRGIDVKGLTEQEAKKKVQEKIDLENEKLVNLKIGEFEYSLEAGQIEFVYNIENAVEEAYNYGRNSNIFVNNYRIIFSKICGKEFNIQSTYNEELLNSIVNDIAAKIPNAVIESSYYIDGEKLVITKGKDGKTIDKEKVKKIIIEKLKNNDGNIINLEVKNSEPAKIDIEKIYNEVHTEPKDAYYVKEPFEVFSHIDGINFDLDLAREILKEDKDEYIIKLTITHPKVTINDIGTEAFPDLLGSFSTKYNAGNINRTTNLRLAATKVNGTVVAPGETFSYNKTVGERTISAGYRDAAGYSGGEVVDMLGGGICQISSTLYDAVVYSNLEIVSRKNHAFLTSYTTAGRDATVVYGAIDFKFKNTRKYPILIKMNVQNGIAKAEIYGIKEDIEYQIDIDTTILSYLTYTTIYKDDETLETGVEKVSQGGMNGCKSITYKVKKLNGVEISREVLSSDTYNPMNRIVKRGVTTENKIEENVPTTPEIPPETPPETPSETPPETPPEIPTEQPYEETNTTENVTIPPTTPEPVIVGNNITNE